MPLLDGIEATRRIRTLGINVYIAGLTANSDTHSRELAVEAGMNGVYLKPLRVDHLRTALENAQQFAEPPT